MTDIADRRPLPDLLRERFRRNHAAVRRRLGKPAKASERTRSRHRRIRLLVAASAVLSIALSAVFLDAASVPWVASLPQPVETFFRAFTDIGQSHWALVPTAILVLLLYFADLERLDRVTRLAWSVMGVLAGYVFVAVAGSGIAANIVKQTVGRGRPAIIDKVGPFDFLPLQFDYVHSGFPSAHSTTMGALIVIFCLFFQRLRLPIVVVGVVIAGSRVMVASHYPSDVIGGLVLGGMFAYEAAYFLARIGYGFSQRPDATIRARTGVVRRAFARPDGARRMLAGLVKALGRR